MIPGSSRDSTEDVDKVISGSQVLMNRLLLIRATQASCLPGSTPDTPRRSLLENWASGCWSLAGNRHRSWVRETLAYSFTHQLFPELGFTAPKEHTF